MTAPLRAISPAQREAFDELVERVLDQLPSALSELVQSVSVIVLDQPEPGMLRDLGIPSSDTDAPLEICGMHSGTPDTEFSIEASGELPAQIHLFRLGIINLCEGFDTTNASSRDAVESEIAITLLHEIGHQFGLDEDDLERLGYE